MERADVASKITRRENEVLDALGERLTNQEIATRLYISERTVESHVSSLLRKLDAADRLELATIARREPVHQPRVPLPVPLARLAATPYAGPFLDAATAALAQPHVGRRVLWIRGEPGIGKTRLLAAIGQRGHGTGAAVLYGRCAEAVGAPFQPFREMIRQWATATPQRAGTVAAVHLAQLAALVPELATEPLAVPKADAYAVFEAVDAFVSALAESAPLLLLLDDVQWADRSSLLLLTHLARSSRPTPVTIVAAYRDTDVNRGDPVAEVSAELRREGHSDTLALTGLDEASVRELVANVGVTLPDDSLARLARQSQGVPFFAIEIAQHLAAGGGHDLPDSVREVIGARVAGLTPATNDALRVASVVGPEFSCAVVAAAAGQPRRDVVDALEEAVAAAIVEEAPDHVERYRFVHDLVREALALEVTATRRAHLHWAVGLALVTETPADVVAVAHHLTEGVSVGDPLQAADANIAAATAARATGAWPEALAGFEQALRLLDAAPDDADRRFQALDGLHRTARAFGHHRTATDASERAIALAREHGWGTRLARVAIDVGVWRSWGRGRGEAARIDLFDEAIAALEPGNDALRVRLLTRRGQMRETLLRDQADHAAVLADAEAAVALADRIGDPIARMESRDLLAGLLAIGGGRQRLLEVGREVVDVADAITLGASRRELFPFPFDAMQLTLAGRLAGEPAIVTEGLSRFERAARESGVPYARSMLLRFQSGIAFAAGQLDDAVALAAEMVARSPHDLGMKLGEWDVRLQAATWRGDFGVAAEMLETALARSGDFPVLLFDFAAVLAALGQHERCRAVYADAVKSGMPWTWIRHRALSSAADVAVRLGDRDIGESLHALVKPYAGTILAAYEGCMLLEGAADSEVGRLETLLGRHDDAVRSLRAGLALEQRNAHEALAARTQTWLAAVLDARGTAGDAAEAERLRADAMTTARRLGLGLITRDLDA